MKSLLTNVRAYGERWGFDDYFTTGKRIQVRRLTKKEAQQAHTDLSVFVANGRKDLAGIDQIRLAKFMEWERSQQSAVSVEELRKKFVASKESDKDLNPGYVYNLQLFTGYYSDEFGTRKATAINVSEFREFLDELGKDTRHRNNIRDAIVAMYRFGRDERLLPDVRSAVEQVKRFKIKRAPTILLWQPDVFDTILTTALAHGFDDLVKFYAIGGFAGVRPEEIRPRKGSPKDPLRWEDFHWRDSFIDVRDETSKTGIGRRAPFVPALKSFMEPYRQLRGPVLDYWPDKKLNRLADLSGIDHRKNASRHSFGTYRHALRKNIMELVEEMGTSIGVARRRYIRPTMRRTATRYFAIRRPTKTGIIQFPKSQRGHKLNASKGLILASK